MFNLPTVFILGAGASKPFNYPTSFELQEEVKNFIYRLPIEEDRSHISKDSLLELKTLEALGFSGIDLLSFCNDLYGAATYSIDKFLEKRPDHIKLGRLLIAYILKQREHANSLFVLHKEFEKDNWYAELANRINLDSDNVDNLKLSFITFNYDRSLEYFLYNLLKNRTMELGKAQDAFKKIKIIHVYGGFGNFPWENNGIPYNSHITVDILKRYADGIKIMNEERDTNESTAAKELINNARNIYFIGFGYDRDNLRRLGIGYKERKNFENIAGTAVGLSPARIEEVVDYFDRKCLDTKNSDILKFLDQQVVYC